MSHRLSFAVFVSFALLAACSDSNGGGTGPATGGTTGSGNNSGAGSQTGGKTCEARCQAAGAKCNQDVALCPSICKTITDVELDCLESSNCDQNDYETCVAEGSSSGKGGTGGSSSGKGGTGGTGGTGGSSSGKGGTGGTGGTGGSSSGGGCLQTDVKDEGTCVARDTKEGANICSSFSAKKNAYACCHVETKDGCSNVGTSENGVSIHCCP